MNFKDRLRDFTYREEEIDVRKIFPRFSPEKAQKLQRLFNLETSTSDPHLFILNLSLYLWNGYSEILDTLGFHDPKFTKFSGHCHQITPALGTMLKLFGFDRVSYLECFRADSETGEMIDPAEEQSEMKDEFCSIGRIPYCCLEVGVGEESLRLSGKHIIKPNGMPKALLTPGCYREMVGVYPHQLDSTKSVIYLSEVEDKPWTKKGEPFVWRRQKLGNNGVLEPVEYFRTFVKMNLVI